MLSKYPILSVCLYVRPSVCLCLSLYFSLYLPPFVLLPRPLSPPLSSILETPPIISNYPTTTFYIGVIVLYIFLNEHVQFYIIEVPLIRNHVNVIC